MFHVEHRCFPRIVFLDSCAATLSTGVYLIVPQGVTAVSLGMQKSLPQFMSSSAQPLMIEFTPIHL
jgi:hypothetical protein